MLVIYKETNLEGTDKVIVSGRIPLEFQISLDKLEIEQQPGAIDVAKEVVSRELKSIIFGDVHLKVKELMADLIDLNYICIGRTLPNDQEEYNKIVTRMNKSLGSLNELLNSHGTLEEHKP